MTQEEELNQEYDVFLKENINYKPYRERFIEALNKWIENQIEKIDIKL